MPLTKSKVLARIKSGFMKQVSPLAVKGQTNLAATRTSLLPRWNTLALLRISIKFISSKLKNQHRRPINTLVNSVYDGRYFDSKCP